MKKFLQNLSCLTSVGVMLLTASVAKAQNTTVTTTTPVTTTTTLPAGSSAQVSPNGSVTVKKTTASDSSTTQTTSAGTISQLGPDAILVKTSSASDPVSYTFNKTTTYVDENGNSVSIDTVKTGRSVTVYYEKDGDKMVATKVVVEKTATTTTNP